MMSEALLTRQLTNQAGLAFDTLADDYDARFTRSHIGRAQRTAVWEAALAVFQGSLSILELNCGTGEDALFLASQGHRVTALDASRCMIDRGCLRKQNEAPNAAIDFHLLPTEHLSTLPPGRFDAIFSNFSGLNCVADLGEVARQLAARTAPGAPLLFCVSTRVCLWESAWFLLHGQLRKSMRRWPGRSTAVLNGVSVEVHYPTVAAFARLFAPNFTLRAVTGIGVFLPPSYLEPWMQHRPDLLRWMSRADRIVCRLALLRELGDHVLLHFIRAEESQ